MKIQRFKIHMSSILIGLLCISLISSVYARNDVNSTASHWYDEAMNYCMEASLFNGIPEELITPDTRITWAIIAQVLANRTANYREEYYQNQINTEDGQNNSWYAPALKWMNEMGMSDVNESPESQISRESAARLLFEYAYKTENETDYSITDSSSHLKDKAIISETAKSAVYWAEEHGIIHGYLDSSFRPDQQILFSEMAQMFYNAKDFLSKNNITVLFSYSVSDIEKIEFQNGSTGELKSYTNKTELNDIIEHLNSFRFDSLEPAGDGWTYAIRIWFKEESAMRRITLSPSSVCVGGNRYISSSGHDYFPQEWIKQYCP